VVGSIVGVLLGGVLGGVAGKKLSVRLLTRIEKKLANIKKLKQALKDQGSQPEKQ
jgi:hypothetical protein